VGAALAPAMAWFYRDPRLVNITLLISIGFLFSGSSVQHIALLNRQMRFKAIACVDVGAMAISLLVGVVMALRGWGYWALVGSQLAASLAEFVLAWSLSSWRPQLPKRGSGTMGMLNFGASLTYATMLRRITSQMDTILIGRFFGAGPLGLYTRAMALLMRPLDQFMVPFDTVFVPLLSRLQKEPERYRAIFLRVSNGVAIASFAIGGMLLGLSRPIVLLLLGPKWEEVIPIFAALAIAAFYYPLAGIGMWLPTTQGRKRDIVMLGSIISAISVGSYLIGVLYGVAGVALAFSLSGLLVRLPIQYHITGRTGPVNRSDLWQVVVKNIHLWALALGVAWGVHRLLIDMPHVVQLAGGIVISLAAVAGSIWLVPHQRRIAQEAIEQLMGFVRRKRQSQTE
jgi:O-antigen/teichoic acid export membrane protein